MDGIPPSKIFLIATIAVILAALVAIVWIFDFSSSRTGLARMGWVALVIAVVVMVLKTLFGLSHDPPFEKLPEEEPPFDPWKEARKEYVTPEAEQERTRIIEDAQEAKDQWEEVADEAERVTRDPDGSPGVDLDAGSISADRISRMREGLDKI